MVSEQTEQGVSFDFNNNATCQRGPESEDVSVIFIAAPQRGGISDCDWYSGGNESTKGERRLRGKVVGLKKFYLTNGLLQGLERDLLSQLGLHTDKGQRVNTIISPQTET